MEILDMMSVILVPVIYCATVVPLFGGGGSYLERVHKGSIVHLLAFIPAFAGMTVFWLVSVNAY